MNLSVRFFFLLIIETLFIQNLIHSQNPFNVTFESDQIGQLPQSAPGNGSVPTTFGSSTDVPFTVAALSGDVGSSTASGKIAEVNAITMGDYRLMVFDATMNAGIITADTVVVAFDFLAKADVTHEGFAFMRGYDETFETIADIAFGFNGDSYTIGLLNYDSETGEYLGWTEPPFPNNVFETGTWYRIEQIIDLTNDIQTLRIDGEDYGITAGVSRATGTGLLGSFINWGTAYVGSCAIDNIQIDLLQGDNGLLEPPVGFLDLFDFETYGGEILTINNGTFSEIGTDWETFGDASLFYDPVYNGIPSYTFIFNEYMEDSEARLYSFNNFPIQPNRTYEISALIRTDFPRATWEINFGLTGANGEDLALGSRYAGVPALTEGPDGWQRWTWRFTPQWASSYEEAKVFLGFHEYGPGYDDNVLFQIADLAFIELPEFPVEPFAPGEGVTFPGGPGDLDMAVEEITENGDILTATVTGAHYIFDRAAGTLDVRQRIDYQRILATYANLPLTGLEISMQNENEAILIGNELTIGVQADGAIVISPQSETTFTSTSVIGGDFNRLEGGDFFSMDDFGGFTTSIYTPKGTGLIPQITPLTADLSFIGLDSEDLETNGAAEENWQVELTMRPGERVFISAFPSRPYDWEKSFEYHWALSDFNEDVEGYDNPEYVDNWILWNISQRGWAMSFGERYELRDNVPYQEHWDAIIKEGDKWSAYFSQWFYYSRDGEEWANEVKRWRDEYGMGAVYSDGLAQDDFLAAYIAMRVLREDVFPDGDIVIHDSYPQSGVPSANYKPFIHTYATSTYMGENAIVEAGADWEWARHVMGQFRRANCFGVTKGDGWEGFNNVEKYYIALVWGGRGRPDVANYDIYLEYLAQLKTMWQTYGDDPYFFDRYYHPEAQILTGYNIGRAGMPIDEFNADQTELVLSSWTPGATVHYTLDGSAPTTDSPEYTQPIAWEGTFGLRAKAFRPDLEESRILEINGDMFTSVNEVLLEKVLPSLVSAFPNPTSFDTNIRYFLPQGATVDIQLVNVDGQVVESFEMQQTAGYHLQTVAVGDLSNGIYFVNMQVEGVQVAPMKLVVIR